MHDPWFSGYALVGGREAEYPLSPSCVRERECTDAIDFERLIFGTNALFL